MKTYLPKDEDAKKIIARRHRFGRIWRNFFFAANVIALLALATLIYSILIETFGYVAVRYRLHPDILAETYLGEARPFDDLNADELAIVSARHFDGSESKLRLLVIEQVLGITKEGNSDRLKAIIAQPVSDLLPEGGYPVEIADKPIGNPPLTAEEYGQILALNLDKTQLRSFVLVNIAESVVVKSWPLKDGLLHRREIEAKIANDPDLQGAELKFRSWLNREFLTSPMHTRPELAGIRTAVLGSAWMITMTILFALPLGVGAALYLEEYAAQNWLNRIIQTNISNLAGVPSIIYGILGLVVFVRILEPITSGSAFGANDSAVASGRTVLAGALTMSLLILPIIIINAQEAIRAVPNSIRLASYGLGATQWQTIWHHVLPNAMPGILTGTILSVSRAIGETAPLIVVGAATYITTNPDSPFSKFTVLPIQIFRWTSEPQAEFRDIAAAAILILLILLLSLNSIAIILRNRFSKR